MTRRRDAGFTLLEVLVALGILAIGLTSAVALLVAAATTAKRAADREKAGRLADTVIAEVATYLDTHADLEDLQLEGRSHSAWPDMTYDIHLTPTDDSGATLLCEVVVRWKRGGQEVGDTYSCLLLRRFRAADCVRP